MSSYFYQICFEPEEEVGYHVYVPALHGCHSFGDTIEEGEANIREAIQLYLECLTTHK